MECGVWVTVQDGKVIRIEGDESAFQSHGNCCTKSQSSVQAAYHPDRLHYPLRRTQPKGEEPGWQRISWDEALGAMAQSYQQIIDQYGGESLFTMGGTSRAWAQACCYSSINALFQTPNSVQALQICKGPRFFANSLVNDMGLYWYEGTGQPRVYVQWGTAVEYSNYDNSCRTIVNRAKNADVHIVIDPRMTPMGKEADYWLNVRPGTDGAIGLCWTKLVWENGLANQHFMKRWTNSPFLVVEELEPSGGFVLDAKGGMLLNTRLLKESDIVEGGSYLRFMAYDNLKAQAGATGNDALTYWDNECHAWEGETTGPQTAGHEVDAPDARVSSCFLPDESQFDPAKDPALTGTFDVTLKDGRIVKARTVWDCYADVFSAYTPEYAAEITGVDANVIRDAGLAWATPLDPESGYGNGGLHFQLAIDHTGNAVQTERVLIILSAITNNTDVPAGNRGQTRVLGVNASPGGPMGDPTLMLDPQRRMPFIKNEKQAGGEQFPVNKWFNMWCDCASLWDQALSGDPYPIRGGYCSASDFMNMANSQVAWDALCGTDFFAVADLWHTPTTEVADILLPAAHWLEVNAPRMSQGASGAVGATVKVIEPPGEALVDFMIAIGLFKAMGRPWCSDPENPWFTEEQELDNDVAGTRMGWKEFAEKFQKEGWIDARSFSPIWHNYRRWETGQLRQMANFGTLPNDGQVGFYTPTGLTEIWSTVVESYADSAYILPDWSEPPRSPISAPDECKEYPLICTTGSRQPVYFHSEHRQLPWCRELWPVPRVELNPADAEELGLEQGDWVWIENANGRVREVVDIYHGISKGVVNANHQWWFPENASPRKGFDLCNINMINYKDDRDPLCGASVLRAFPVKIYKATAENSPEGNPVPVDPVTGREIITSPDDPRLKEWVPSYEGRE